MSPLKLAVPARLGAFALSLLAVFGVAAAVGAGVHPGQPAPADRPMAAIALPCWAIG